MKIDTFFGKSNIPFTTAEIDKVINLVTKHFPFAPTIKVEEVTEDKAEYLIGIKIRAYYETPVIGYNERGERIATAGIKLSLHHRIGDDEMGEKGMQQYNMSVHGIGRYFEAGGHELCIIEPRPDRYTYLGYQYDTELEEFDWEGLSHFFKKFTTMRRMTKGQTTKVLEAFKRASDKTANVLALEEYR